MKFGPKEILSILLTLGGLGFGTLTIGAFAQANKEAPLEPIMAILRALDGIAAVIPPFSLVGKLEEQAFSRGFAYMGMAVVLTSLAAIFVGDTRASKVPTVGRKGA